MSDGKRGRRLAYAHILRALDPRKRYGVEGIMRFAEANGLVKPSPDDPRENGVCTVSHKQIHQRIRSRINWYKESLAPEEGAMVYGDDFEETGWYACYWQLCILKLSPVERSKLGRIMAEMKMEDLDAQRADAEALREQNRIIQDLDKRVAAAQRRLRKWTKINRKYEQRRQSVSRKMRTGTRVALALAIVGLLTTAGGVAWVWHPFDVLRAQGPAAARRALGEGEPRTPEARYQDSWMAYLAGEHERAAQGVYAILAQAGTTPHMRANCFYLLGSIQSKKGRFRMAIGPYLEAYEQYGTIDDHANLFNTSVEIANAHTALGEYVQAEHWLGGAWDHYQSNRTQAATITDLGQYYLVRTDLAAAQGDCRAALNAAKARLMQAEQSDDRALLPYAFRLVGFWSSVNGCGEMGSHYSRLGSDAATAIGDERAMVFCLVNTVLNARHDSQTIAYIRDWAALKNDARLAQALELALTIPILENSSSCSGGE